MLKQGNVFEKTPHLRFWTFLSEDTTCGILKHLPLTGKPTRIAPLTTVGASITDAAVPSSDGSGPEEMKSSKRKEKKKRLSQRKTEISGRLKKSCTEHHLVSKAVVQNTTKMTFSLPEKTSYLAIVADAWCNDW